MDVGMNLGQSQRLEQTLSPQLLQSVNILQKNALELEVAIKAEMEANPLLELDESLPDEFVSESKNSSDSDNLDSADDFDKSASLDDQAKGADSIEEMDFGSGTLYDSADTDYDILDNTSDSDWVKRLEDGSSDVDAPFKDLNSGSQDPNDAWDRPQKDRDGSLQDKLREQLDEWNGNPLLLGQLAEEGCDELRFRDLVRYLIDSLDENGFLQGADEIAMAKVLADNDKFIVEIERVIRNEIPLEVASLPVAEAVHVLQSFKPRGIGARNLQESFLIQAMAIDDFPSLAIEILKDHFEDLEALHYGKIAKDMGVATDEVQQAVSSLSRLAPHPGLQISGSHIHVKVVDLRVVEKRGRFEVECQRSALKRLRINKMYAGMLDNKNLSKSDREYFQQHLAKAKDFIKAVDNRFTTMEKVMRAIVDLQPEFFKKGKAFLKPMILQDVATIVERDLSTVSRVTNGKYVETPFGIFELKDFFTSGVKQGAAETDAVVGSAQVIDAIKELIDGENKKKPLSDQAIADLLSERGIQVARRTVAKYREEELKILSARLRKIC